MITSSYRTFDGSSYTVHLSNSDEVQLRRDANLEMKSYNSGEAAKYSVLPYERDGIWLASITYLE